VSEHIVSDDCLSIEQLRAIEAKVKAAFPRYETRLTEDEHGGLLDIGVCLGSPDEEIRDVAVYTSLAAIEFPDCVYRDGRELARFVIDSVHDAKASIYTSWKPRSPGDNALQTE